MSDLHVSRRRVLAGGVGACLAPAVFSVGDLATAGETQASAPEDLKAFPQQSPELVREVVGVSHGRFDRVRELVTVYPELAKASWDWGFGDWESALGAASHTGNREIALFLIEHGARPNLFTFTMLGYLEIVNAMLAVQPQLVNLAGPHGLSLLHHARVGREHAAAVRAFIEKLESTRESEQPLTSEQRQIYFGKYVSQPYVVEIEVMDHRLGMAVRANNGPPRLLTQVAEHKFHPAGATSVRLEFEVEQGVASAVELKMGRQKFRAVAKR